MSEPQSWDARTAGADLLAAVTRTISEARAATRGGFLSDTDIARAVLGSPALLESCKATLDSLEGEYKPKIAAHIAAEAEELIEQATPVIRAAVAEEIAVAIERSVCEPGEQCAEKWCPDCVKYRQAHADAATARRIGGAQ